MAEAIRDVLRRGLQKYPDPMAGAFRRRAAELWADAEGLELSFMNSRRALDMDAEADVRRAVEELAGPGAEVAKAMSGEEVIALLREAEEALGTVVRAVEGCWPAAGYAYAVIKALP